MSEFEPVNSGAFYERHYAAMFEPMLEMMLHGVRVDNRARQRKHAHLMAEIVAIQETLTTISGESLYGKADLSNKKLQRFLYETLRLPKQYAKRAIGQKTVTANEVAVRKLMLRFPGKLGEAGELILAHRRKSTLKNFLKDERISTDGRLRYSLGFTPETGRLNSSTAPDGTGTNIQNQDREIRDIYVPDKGCVFLEMDLSQAESREVGMLTRDPRLMEKAQTPPWEFDVHTDNAMLIFGCKREEVTKLRRFLGKKAVHASNYGMRGFKLSEELLKDGYVFTPDECDRMIDRYLAANPAIVEWQKDTRIEVLEFKMLANSWGRRLDFSSARMNDDIYRRAYAFRPQSEVADLLNQWGLVPVYQYIKSWFGEAHLNTHGHDSLLISAPPSNVYALAEFLRKSLERPRRIGGGVLKMPCEFKLGMNWGSMMEFKRLPTQKKFEEAAHDVYSRGNK